MSSATFTSERCHGGLHSTILNKFWLFVIVDAVKMKLKKRGLSNKHFICFLIVYCDCVLSLFIVSVFVIVYCLS